MSINWLRVARVCFGIIIIRFLAGPFVAAGVLAVFGLVVLIKKLRQA